MKYLLSIITITAFSCASLSKIEREKKTIPYVLQDNVTQLLKEELKKFSSKIFFNLNHINGDTFKIELIKNNSNRNNIATLSNRKLLLGKELYPVVVDYDENFATLETGNEILKQARSGKYLEYKKRFHLYHYFYYIDFILNGNVIKTGYDNLVDVEAQDRNDKSTNTFHCCSEYDIDLAKSIFLNKYDKKDFKKFEGKVEEPKENMFKYDEKIIKVNHTDDELEEIFRSGLIYSNLIIKWDIARQEDKEASNEGKRSNDTILKLLQGDTLIVSCVNELPIKDKNKNVKRFGFSLVRNGVANPILYFFELTNYNADKKTTMHDFIKGSKISFFKMVTVMI